MGETRDNEYEDELLDYEEEDAQAPDCVATKANGEAAKKSVLYSFYFYVGLLFCQDSDFIWSGNVFMYLLYLLPF